MNLCLHGIGSDGDGHAPEQIQDVLAGRPVPGVWTTSVSPSRHTTATLTLWIGGSESNRHSNFSPLSRPIQS
jgi:hypothetical protein